jgi:hypothetical protein
MNIRKSLGMPVDRLQLKSLSRQYSEVLLISSLRITSHLYLTFSEDRSNAFTTLPSKMEDSKLLPPGIRDPSRRVLSNTGVKDKATIEKYGVETNGE